MEITNTSCGLWKLFLLVNGVTFVKGLSLRLRPNYQLVTVENQSSFSEKGQKQCDVRENCSLTSQIRKLDRTRDNKSYNTLDDAFIREHPQTPLSSHPYLESIRPITSSGIFSPPYNLPLVRLPNHSPISPIGLPTVEDEVFESESVFSTPPCDIRPRRVFDVQQEDSNVHDWLGALSPEWDSYEQFPTFYKKGFSDSFLFSPIQEEGNSVRKIQIVSTEQSELSEDSKFST